MRTAFGADFDVPDGYLNTPSIGVPLERAADAVAEAVACWRTGAARSTDFGDPIARSRQAFAELIGVPVDRIAIGPSASQLISMVAAGVPDRAKVLVVANEFTSVTFPFAAQAHRGVTLTETDRATLPSAVEGHDLVAVSAVQSDDGAQVDLEALRAAAESARVPVLIDATQAAGWQPLRLDWADWVVAAGYKWLMAPRGAAWLAVHPRSFDRTIPVAASWYSGENPWQTTYGLPLRLAEGTRRFDLSPVWLAHVGAAVSLPYLASLDLTAVRAHCIDLADTLLARLGLPPRGTAIASIDADIEKLAAAGVAASTRNGRTRLGFHLYNTRRDVEMVLAALR